MTIVAALPPALLWAASLATSTDPSKGPICAIEARQEPSGIRLVGVDGHRCFRCVLPASLPYFVPETPLRLSPKAFSKAPTLKTVLVELDDGGVASFKDKFGNVTSSIAWQADPWAMSEQSFPNVEQIFPTKLPCTPGDFVGMNASYLGDFMKVAAKIGRYPGAVKLFTGNDSTLPMIWEATLDNCWINGGEADVLLQYLLSPVLMRKA
jgi:hypothetical protein